jgi:D-xylose transport system substrate-binding protein
MKRIFVIMIAVILMFQFFSCKKKEESKLTTEQESKLRIGLSMDTLQEERWHRDRDYFIEYAKELGADVSVQVANGSDDLQLQHCQNLITQSVNVLVIVPHNQKTTAKAVRDAHAAKIKVIAYDRMIEDCDVDLYVSFDGVRVGELQGEYAVKHVPKGNYVIINGAKTDHNAHLFREGYMKVLQPYIDRGDIKIVHDEWAEDWKPENAQEIMENALANYKVDAVVAANDGTASGAIQAIKAEGLEGKILVTGQDADLAACQSIAAGTQTMTVFKDVKELAKAGAEAAMKFAQGQEVKGNGVVNNGSIDVPSILIAPVSVDKDNLYEVIVKSGFHKKKDVYQYIPESEQPSD